MRREVKNASVSGFTLQPVFTRIGADVDLAARRAVQLTECFNFLLGFRQRIEVATAQRRARMITAFTAKHGIAKR